MPYTWDGNCFRGDSVAQAKPPGEMRLFILGGSTVQSFQPDADMWATPDGDDLIGRLIGDKVKAMGVLGRPATRCREKYGQTADCA
jgi:hypothetical protein